MGAVVVGSGPNGLAAAVTIARAGHPVTVLEAEQEPGGGSRSELDERWGTTHDLCSAVHPLGAASPLFASLGLERHGLEWLHGEVALAHPLEGGGAALHRSIRRTAEGLGPDGRAWERSFAALSDSFAAVSADLMGPLLRIPDHPFATGRFALGGVRSAKGFARRFDREEARALFAGCAAHAMRPLGSAMSASVGSVLVAAGHSGGWPVARGGSASITSALLAELGALGGEVRTGVRVRTLADLPAAQVVLLDVAPRAALSIVGDAMPARVARAFARWRHGPSAHKVDLVVRGGIPWTDPDSRRAVTVHVGGTGSELAEAEDQVHRGRMPERPFVLVAQQYLADPGRSNGDHHPVWAYAHVPRGYTGDATQPLLAQVERFAPGFRDTIVDIRSRGPAELEAHNANYVDGDIATGANSAVQLVFRPRPAIDPYRVADKVYLCSAATPPGAGVHGMCGWHAARSALRQMR